MVWEDQINWGNWKWVLESFCQRTPTFGCSLVPSKVTGTWCMRICLPLAGVAVWSHSKNPQILRTKRQLLSCPVLWLGVKEGHSGKMTSSCFHCSPALQSTTIDFILNQGPGTLCKCKLKQNIDIIGFHLFKFCYFLSFLAQPVHPHRYI